MRFFTAIRNRLQPHKRLLLALIGLLLVGVGAPLLAGPADFSTIETSLRSTEHGTIGIIGGTSIVGGIVFFIASAFKFQRWKQNPQQISVGQGVYLMMIGVAMISLPFTMSTAKRAVMGKTEQINQFGDSRLAGIVSPPSMDEE